MSVWCTLIWINAEHSAFVINITTASLFYRFFDHYNHGGIRMVVLYSSFLREMRLRLSGDAICYMMVCIVACWQHYWRRQSCRRRTPLLLELQHLRSWAFFSQQCVSQRNVDILVTIYMDLSCIWVLSLLPFTKSLTNADAFLFGLLVSNYLDIHLQQSGIVALFTWDISQTGKYNDPLECKPPRTSSTI